MKIVCDISFFYLDKIDPKGTILVECGKMLQRGAPKMDKDGKTMKDKRGKVMSDAEFAELELFPDFET